MHCYFYLAGQCPRSSSFLSTLKKIKHSCIIQVSTNSIQNMTSAFYKRTFKCIFKRFRFWKKRSEVGEQSTLYIGLKKECWYFNGINSSFHYFPNQPDTITQTIFNIYTVFKILSYEYISSVNISSWHNPPDRATRNKIR